jgi:xanthine dehydrogenase large subunit
VHVYSDGSIHLNHGGCEMGQGLHTKVAQVAAEAFQVDLGSRSRRRRPRKCQTPLRPPPPLGRPQRNGQPQRLRANQGAADTFRMRILRPYARPGGLRPQSRTARPRGRSVRHRDRPSPDGTGAIVGRRILYGAEIHWNRAKGRGRPFYYFGYGAACAEVSLDTFTVSTLSNVSTRFTTSAVP